MRGTAQAKAALRIIQDSIKQHGGKLREYPKVHLLRAAEVLVQLNPKLVASEVLKAR